MKKLIMLIFFILMATSAFSETVKGEKNDRFADICDFKVVGDVEGFALVNVVGRCAWDPALNGEYLSLTFVGQDPMESATEVDLGVNVRKLNSAKFDKKRNELVILADQETFDFETDDMERIIVQTLKITVKAQGSDLFDIKTEVVKKK